MKRAAADDSGYGTNSNSSTQKSLVIPEKKYYGSPRSAFYTAENNSGLTGMTRELLMKYKNVRNIKDLYPWQAEFLNDPRVLRGNNALLTAQTGGGKTLIAEILMLRQICNRNCSAIFVLPLVALVQEKILAFKALAEAFQVRVEEYAAHRGRIPPIKRQDHRSLFVCTIEKASLLINSLMEKNQLKTVGLLVLDEVHMIGESGRGANLECLIAKFAAACSGQIVAMSATIGNAEELATFLGGFHYHNANRPVELKQYLTFQKTVCEVKEIEGLEAVKMLKGNDPADPDGVIELALEIVPQHSVLIFCNSRAACENLCSLLCSKVTDELKMHKPQERFTLVEELKAETDNQAAALLKKGLRTGIAYHHAGLMNCERQVVEAAFHSGAISIVCATSTLAAGVNLPARRVIIRSPKIGISFMTKSQFLQMAGRAGRAGFDDHGECFVIANEGREKIKRIIMEDPVPDCKSQLGDQLESFILDLVGLGFTKVQKLNSIIRSTLYAIQNQENIDQQLTEALEKLVETKFLVKVSDEDYGLDVYGRGKFHSGLSPEEIPIVIEHFSAHFESGISFKTRFSIIYICVPFDIRITVDWDVYHGQYKKLADCDKRMFGHPMEVESSIYRHLGDRSAASIKEMRLYTALLIYRLCKYGMNSIYNTSNLFKVPVGWIQQTYDSMCHRSQALGRFSEHIEVMWPLKGLLPDLVSYLRSAGNEEIAQLMTVDGITRQMAHCLVRTRLNTVGSLARTTVAELRETLGGRLRTNLAEKIIFNAKCVLRDAIDEKKEEIANMGGLLTGEEIL